MLLWLIYCDYCDYGYLIMIMCDYVIIVINLLWLNYKTRLNIINKWHFIFRMLKRAKTWNNRLIKRI